MSILDILRKHQVPDACIADVKALLHEIPVTTRINTAEATRVGVDKLKEYLKRDAARQMARDLEKNVVSSEINDEDGKLTEMRYTLTVVKERSL